jgi:flagellar hook-basal body complex protein FliE
MKTDVSSLMPNNSTVSSLQRPKKNAAGSETSGAGFVDTLKGFVNDVNRAQNEAGESVNRLLTGEIKDVHDVMVAVQKAGTSFELMMEVRNKMIDTYREVMRMQV